MVSNVGWIAVDLDGTLAYYNGWVSPEYIGPPIPKMLARVKQWIQEGKTVKIFTARCSVPEQVAPVAAWLEKHGIGGLEITNVKDYGMIELWDDRCTQVVANTGEAVTEKHMIDALEKLLYEVFGMASRGELRTPV